MKRLIPIALLLVIGIAYGSTLSRLKTWTTREILTVSDLNNEFDNIVNHINGSLGSANIDSTGRIRIDTLDVQSGIRLGSTATATLGNVLWANGSFHISVSKDSAGIVAKTGAQTIAGTKTFSGYTILGSSGVGGGGTTASSHVWFAYLPLVTGSLAPSTDSALTTKVYVDTTIGSRVSDSLDLIRTGMDSVTVWYDISIADSTADVKEGFKASAKTVAGEALVFSNIVYFAIDSTWMKADADTVSGSGTSFSKRGMGFVVADISNGSSGIIMTRGIARASGWNLPYVGGDVYLSTTDGTMTQSPDTTAGNAVQIIGWAIAPDLVKFNFDQPWARK